jgi:hypothetical protein
MAIDTAEVLLPSPEPAYVAAKQLRSWPAPIHSS